MSTAVGSNPLVAAWSRTRRPALIGALSLALLAGLAVTVVLDRNRTAASPPLLAEVVRAPAAEQAAWLAAGTVPQVLELGESTMFTDALRDLHALGQPDGVTVAGWAGPWRYVWPRDSGLAAAALARTGHLSDAVRILDFLQRMQPESGVFQARYRPDGSGVPDDRGEQLDGLGWALWATSRVAAGVPPADRAGFVRRYQSMIDRSTATTLALIDNRRSLPPVSADYWETREWRLTLATAAMLHAGLQAAAELYASVGDVEGQRRAGDGAGRLASAIERRFGPDGYPRHLGGRADSVDLGVDFLLPPFSSHVDPGVVRAWRHAGEVMARPAGGLAPGGSWRDDGLSWTTSTSIHALTAAALGDREQAVRWLRWLDQHRTSTGSLPEKVTAAGAPAAVAPLAWAAAAVILTAYELDH